MATGDMLARLLLDSSGFEKNMKKSKRDTDNFKKAGREMGKELVTQFKKVVGAALAINGAADAFKAFVNSSQTLGDKFRTNVEGMKTVVDNLVYSLANADFSSFVGGLNAMFYNAKVAAAARDQLGNTTMAANYIYEEKGSEFREAIANARNKGLSKAERDQWMKIAKARAKEINEALNTLERDTFDALIEGIAAKTNLSGGDIKEQYVKKALELDAKRNNKKERDKIESSYSALLKANQARIDDVMRKYTRVDQNMVTSLQGGGTPTVVRLKGYTEAMAEAQRLNAKALQDNAELVTKYVLLFRNSDEELKQVYTDAKQVSNARKQSVEINKMLVETENLLATERKAAQEAAKNEVKEPEGGWKTEVPGVRAMPQIANTFPGQVGMISIGGESVSEDQKAFDWAIMKDAIKQAKGLEDVNTIVGELSGSFATLGSNIEGTAGSMFTFIGATLDAVQAIIPLIGYIQAEATMRDENATAAAKEAAAKTLSAYANIPFAGIALGVAGVAAIITAIQSVPKFAEGGIVNRATLGVFGEAGPEAVMPLDKLEEYITPREMRVTGNIKASGKDLVVVLDNYNRVRNG